MTWRTARRYTKTGGRGYGAEPVGTSVPQRPEPSRPTPRPRPTQPPGTTTPSPRPRPTPQPRPTPGPRIPPTTTEFVPVPMPRPTLRFIPKADPRVFHPPGPGIGTRPGPAPALGRPGDLPGDHGGWKNESCYSRGSKGWKPDIMTLGDAHICPGEKGPQSPYRPPNVSGNSARYNTKLFRSEGDVAAALNYIGYQSPDGNAMLRRFQRDWNFVSNRIAMSPMLYADITFAYLPQGIVKQDGEIGPQSLNALEVAVVNQRMADLPWHELVMAMRREGPRSGYGRQKMYNAAQGM